MLDIWICFNQKTTKRLTFVSNKPFGAGFRQATHKQVIHEKARSECHVRVWDTCHPWCFEWAQWELPDWNHAARIAKLLDVSNCRLLLGAWRYFFVSAECQSVSNKVIFHWLDVSSPRLIGFHESKLSIILSLIMFSDTVNKATPRNSRLRKCEVSHKHEIHFVAMCWVFANPSWRSRAPETYPDPCPIQTILATEPPSLRCAKVHPGTNSTLAPLQRNSEQCKGVSEIGMA